LGTEIKSLGKAIAYFQREDAGDLGFVGEEREWSRENESAE
jgi:hypothetical protein